MPPIKELLEIWLPVLGLFLLLAGALGGVYWLARQRGKPYVKGAVALGLLGCGGLCLYAIYPPAGRDPLGTAPVLLLGLLALGLAGMLVWQTFFGQYRFVRRQLSPVVCEKCHYDLCRNRSGACPECGTPVSEPNRRRLEVRAREAL